MGAVAAAVVIAALMGGAPMAGRYRHWKRERALRQAAGFFDRGDLADGGLAIEVAFGALPGAIDPAAAASSLAGHGEALQALMDLYRARDDAAGMLAAAAALRRSDPASREFQYNWALLTVLTEPAGDWGEAARTLEALHARDVGDPYLATGYAFALARAGRAREALAAAEGISRAERDDLRRLPYMALIFGLNGRVGEVARLQKLSAGGAYLPEEKRLFDEALAEAGRNGFRAGEAGSAAQPPTWPVP
jgi:hypothetical protein